jgi:hypothetical protein
MRVEAIKVGFSNNQYREPGEVFEIEDHLFSGRWMKKIGGKVPVGKVKKQNEPREPVAYSRLDKTQVPMDEVI